MSNFYNGTGSTPYAYMPTGASGQDAQVIKASPGIVYGIQLCNIAATPVYFKMYDKATAPTALNTPVMVICVPGNTAGAGYAVTLPGHGIAFTAGISFRVSTGITDADGTAVTTSQQRINVDYD